MNPARHEFQLPCPDIRDLVLDLVNHLDAMVAFWNADQVCAFANDAYVGWFGKTARQVVGMTMQELLGPLYELNLPHIEAALRGERQVFERAITTPAGVVRHSLATYIPYVHQGRVVGFFAHVADVSPLKKLEQELLEAKTRAEDLATHDFLTGLPNRVLLMDRLASAMDLATRHGDMVAVLSTDLDEFKSVNDRFGHIEGDRLLVEIATRMTSALRGSDSVTRLGGDEFLVLAQGIKSRSEAEAVARRILEQIGRELELGGAPFRPHVSIGIALFPSDGLAPQELIARSDQALYYSKRLGKRRYAFFDDIPRD